MQFYGKSEAVCKRILELFRSGNVPAALAPVFVRRNDLTPCRSWSWSNQLLTALAGTDDARGFRQWQHAGRCVRKGAKAFHILAPCTVKRTKRDDAGDEREYFAVVGFRSVPVFRLEDTDVADAEKWNATPAAQIAEHEQRFIDALPLVSVANSWGLNVDTYNGRRNSPLGWYSGDGQRIGLGTRNTSTWAHELTHAADDRNGKLTKRRGQQLDNEVVAELGGAILLTMLGDEHAADYGGCWRYVSSYAERNNVAPIRVCEQLLSRTCEAVALILDTAAELEAQPADAESGAAA